MPVINHTDHLNERLYRRLIENVALHLGVNVYDFMEEWEIHLWPLSATRTEYFEHKKTTSGQRINPDIPSGVTGLYRMDLFLHDYSHVFKFRENSDRIQHEVCHAVLIGTDKMVKGVHDKISPAGSYLKSFKFPFWTNRWRFWDRILITVIDVRDDIP